ncbi:hypothetical protein CR513_03279, partial [Mucuna pruriens]
MRLQGIPKDYIKMKAFPFSLDEVAKDWFSSRRLEPRPSKKNFVGKDNILERLYMSTGKDLSYVPHVHIIKLASSLTMMDKCMINVASGGALMDKTPVVARQLISNMVSNTQQFGIRGTDPPQLVNEVSAIDNLRLENQLTELTSLVR